MRRSRRGRRQDEEVEGVGRDREGGGSVREAGGQSVALQWERRLETLATRELLTLTVGLEARGARQEICCCTWRPRS